MEKYLEEKNWDSLFREFLPNKYDTKEELSAKKQAVQNIRKALNK